MLSSSYNGKEQTPYPHPSCATEELLILLLILCYYFDVEDCWFLCAV